MAKNTYIIDETEERANRYVAKMMMLLSMSLVGVLVLNELHIFRIESAVIRICTPLCLMFSLVPSYLIRNSKYRHSSDTKYWIVGLCIISVGIVVTMLNFHSLTLLVLPLLLSTQYHSKSVARMSYIGTTILCFLAPYLGCLLGTWQNDFFHFLEDLSMIFNIESLLSGSLSFKAALEILGFIIIPISFILTIYYRIIISITANGVELNHLRKDLQKEVEKKTRNLVDNQKKLQNITIEVVSALVEASEAKDFYTAGHGKRVALLSSRIAKEMGWYAEDIDNLFICALLHDIGKIAIPDEILKSAETLSKDEYEVVKTHTVRGFEILSEVSSLKEASTVALNHHERWDGEGYPDGLKGKEIDELSRIVAVADAYDAMTSSRAYRNNYNLDRIIEEFEKGKGKQFDPIVAEAFLRLLREGEIDAVI